MVRPTIPDIFAATFRVFAPPFDKTQNDPGYIKAYPPGVRENGGQYTHAALWAVLATAMRGEADRAFELFQMLNPLTHGATPDGVAQYKVEPYVVAADVYTSPSHLGRGGWTWYTGSASWMYRVGIESLLGFTKRGDQLTLTPRVPTGWASFQLTYRFGTATYRIDVREPSQLQAHGMRVVVDGNDASDDVIHLVDDGRVHDVLIQPKAGVLA